MEGQHHVDDPAALERAFELAALELAEPAARYAAPMRDRRPLMPEPPPVRLVAVEDVHADAPAGVEAELDDFYATMLQFDREPPPAHHDRDRNRRQEQARGRDQHHARARRHDHEIVDQKIVDREIVDHEIVDHEIVYRAENLRLRLAVREPPLERADMRPIAIEVRSLAEAENKIAAREFEYERLKALVAGQDALMLRDPAGNWVAIVESRQMR